VKYNNSGTIPLVSENQEKSFLTFLQVYKINKKRIPRVVDHPGLLSKVLKKQKNKFDAFTKHHSKENVDFQANKL